MRLAIEPMACRLAAEKINEKNSRILLDAISRMKAAAKGEDDLLDADIAFHLGILEASDNRFFWNMRHTIEVALRFSIRINNRNTDAAQFIVDEHQSILDFILQGDAQAAEEAMRELLIKAKMLLSNELENENKAK
jgi:DNA-binding FadR family transcriptional regulator